MYSLARQLARDLSHSWDWVARMPCYAEKWLFTFLTYTIINTLISMKCRELPERILRKKSYRKTRLTHPQSLIFDSPNSSTVIVRTYVIHLLGTYITILCNWLILWQNVLYLYLGRFRMYLNISRNHVSRSSVEAFKSAQENKLKVQNY